MRSKILQFIRKRYGSRGSALVAVALLLVVALVSKGQFYSFSNAQQHVIGQANTGAVYSLQGRATRVADGDTFTLRSGDRKSTRLNSSHVAISYAVFCLKKKKRKRRDAGTSK